MPTLRQFLHNTRETLAAAGIPEPRLEPEIMLTNVLGVPRHRLYAVQDQGLPAQAHQALAQFIERRLKREPLAYILGHKEFYGIDLVVDPGVMVPRPETELLVERAILVCMERMDQGRPVVVDVGTGAGGIAINLALHLPKARVFATEVSPSALEVARANIRTHKVEERITLVQGNLLATVEGPVDVIVANLPYIPSDRLKKLQPEVRWEPPIALDGGPDGLDLIRKLLGQARENLSRSGIALLEIDPEHQAPLRQLVGDLFPGAAASVEQDMARLDRIFAVELPG